MNRKAIILLVLLWLVAAVSYACAEDYPAGGMAPREVPVTAEVLPTAEQGFFGNIKTLLRKALTAEPVINGPAQCVTGETYVWTLSDRTSTAATNLYELEMTVQDGTYADPNTADIMYKPARSRETELEYTFYIPGTYVVFMDVYASETAKEPLKTAWLVVTVADGGENELTRKVREVVAQHPAENETERAFALHDWILDNCVYDGDNVYYSAESLLLHGTGVCNSYTRAYALLLREAGIDCYRVSGYVNGKPSSGHAWNAVKLDGKWYLVDCTWDDDNRSDWTREYARHAYCAVTSQLLAINHTPQHYAGVAFWPDCSSLDDNWFVYGDRWREYAPDLFTEYSEKLETGWHRFSLEAPVIVSGKYQKTMLGMVIAYALSHTEWMYGEGKVCTGEFSYSYDTGLITGSHTMSGILKMPWGLTRIEGDSFANAKANMVVIWDNCEYIGPGAFAGMDLWELAVGSKSMEIDEKAFEGIGFVYVIAAEDSSIADFARKRGWAVGDGNGINVYTYEDE